ncbi:MAG: hypothetical protein QM636_00175 [Rhizobium sp.]
MARFHPKLAPSRPRLPDDALPDDALEEEMAAMPYNAADRHEDANAATLAFASGRTVIGLRHADAFDRSPALCRRTFYLTHIDENQDLNNGH